MIRIIFYISIIILLINQKIFPQHELYTRILSEYVNDGLVDYDNLCIDEKLYTYLEALSNTDPEKLPDNNSRLAFWINVYNAFTLKVICDNYPVESINDLNWGGMILSQFFKKSIWHRKFIVIADKTYSLNDIEHGIIRTKFNDPRIHFALVCAALSCPKLRSEAYTADKLEEQLNEQGRIFLNNSSKNRYDLKNKTAYLSRYFDWYDDDFGKSEKEILKYISYFVSDKSVAKSLYNEIEKWEIEFIPYNWCLNKKGAVMGDERCVVDLDTFR